MISCTADRRNKVLFMHKTFEKINNKDERQIISFIFNNPKVYLKKVVLKAFVIEIENCLFS